jgi:hypothetical protein
MSLFPRDRAQARISGSERGQLVERFRGMKASNASPQQGSIACTGSLTIE